jgi:NAD(P)H-hydrate epimerase
MNTTTERLAAADKAAALDKEAHEWGFDEAALVEAAGRACADALVREYPALSRVAVFAGSGNNAADALVLLRTLLIRGQVKPADCVVFLLQKANGNQCRTAVLRSLEKMGVTLSMADDESAVHNELLARFGNKPDARPVFFVDGIAGTGLKGPLGPKYHGWLRALTAPGAIVSIDVPSGLRDNCRQDDPLVYADLTLAIEPVKAALYTPFGRRAAGRIVPVTGIFPSALIEKYASLELLSWPVLSQALFVRPFAHKYTRGVVEIHAGQKGSVGAAVLAATGARAAGAGLVRLVVDSDIYPLVAQAVAATSPGIMVTTTEAAEKDRAAGRFRPASLLLGPGWGVSPERKAVFDWAVRMAADKEAALVLDADALKLASGVHFAGSVILTPHPGEFAAWAGLDKVVFEADPRETLTRMAAESGAVIAYKSCVTWVAAPDSSLAVADGMNATLGTGGTGDVLAGLIAGIAARTKPFDAARAGATLLAAAGRMLRGFADPLETAKAAAELAGKAWMEVA